jgi:protein involved in polysaccharide export with SLBB domain
MKILACFSAFLACALLTGCGTYGSQAPSTTPMAMGGGHPANDVMRVGDRITIRLTGVPDTGYFNEVQISPSGDITVDLLAQPFHAAGKTPSELAAEITDAYKSQKIYTNPVVTVLPEERYVNVGGDVRSPTRVIYTADATVISMINACGGFDEYANRRAVRVIRGQQVMVVDCVKAEATAGGDPPVYPGDQIYVPRTVF